jgi:hypothetical protein
MKTLKLFFIALGAALLLAGCTENSESPQGSDLDTNTILTVDDEGEAVVEEPVIVEEEESIEDESVPKPVDTQSDEIIITDYPGIGCYGLKEGLDEELKKRIQQDYWDDYVSKQPPGFLNFTSKTKEHVCPIYRYYGTYNGCVVIVHIYSPATMVWGENVAGIGFMEPRPPGVTVWKDGSFYTLTELYTQGLLTYEDLLRISNIQRKIYIAEGSS